MASQREHTCVRNESLGCNLLLVIANSHLWISCYCQKLNGIIVGWSKMLLSSTWTFKHLVGSTHTVLLKRTQIALLIIADTLTYCIMDITYTPQQSLKARHSSFTKNHWDIHDWLVSHFHSAEQLASRNEMFSWKCQMRLLKFFNNPLLCELL